MKRFLPFLLAICLLISFSIASTAEVGQDEIITVTAADYPNTDLTEHKTVNYIVITDVPDDYDKVLAYVNARLESEFNTTLEFTLVTWADWQTMYPLMMASGDAYDMVWMPPGRGLYTYIEQEFLVTVDKEFVEKYMPFSFKYQSQASWDQVTYKGRYAGIPQGVADAGGATDMIAVRNDILEKYGYATLNTWDDIKGIWLAIAADTGETGLIALSECKTNAYGFSLYTQSRKVVTAGNTDNFKFIWKDGAIPTPEEVFFLYDSDFAKEAFAEMKLLADAGVWSRSTLSNTTSNYTTFSQGAAATGCFNGSIYWYVNELKKQLGVESTVFVIGQQDGTQMVMCENYNQNTFAFYIGSPDLQRAAMVMDILKYDTDLNHTFAGGLLDYHRVEATPGFYTEGEHANSYQFNSFCICWGIKNGSLKALYEDEKRNEAQAWMDSVGLINPTAAFVYNGIDVQPYITAVNATVEEYRYSLRLGLVEDEEATYGEFVDKLYEAGLQEYFDSYIGQYTEWYATVAG